jgi:hypothetical protein
MAVTTVDLKLVVALIIVVLVLVGATGGDAALAHVGNGVRDVLHWITHDVFHWISTTWHSLVQDNGKSST